MSGHQKAVISQRVFLLSALFSAQNHVKQYLDIPLIGLGASTNEIFLHKILEQSRTLIYLGKSGYKGIRLQHTAGLYDPECISILKGSSVLPSTASSREKMLQRHCAIALFPMEVYQLHRFSLITTLIGKGARILCDRKILKGILQT